MMHCVKPCPSWIEQAPSLCHMPLRSLTPSVSRELETGPNVHGSKPEVERGIQHLLMVYQFNKDDYSVPMELQGEWKVGRGALAGILERC